MQRWIHLVLLIAVLLLGVGSFFAYRAVARRRDLRETLLWMDQTYNPPVRGDTLGRGHGWEIHYLTKDNVEHETERFGMTFSSKGGCDLEIRTETFPVGAFSETPSVSIEELNLGDIDPNSIKIKTYDSHKDAFDCSDPEAVRAYQLNCDSAEILFRTRNDAIAISGNTVTTYTKLTGSDHQSRSVSKTNNSLLLVDDVAYGRRLAKALKHAVELCGGRPSKF